VFSPVRTAAFFHPSSCSPPRAEALHRNPISPSADPCKDVELQVERVWSAGVRAQVLGYGGGIEAGERQDIVNKMDAISEDWVRLRLAVCNDFYKRKLITQDDYQRQVKCFDDRLDQQRKLVTLLQGPDTSSASKLRQRCRALLVSLDEDRGATGEYAETLTERVVTKMDAVTRDWVMMQE
jgi:hypothetical protein